MPGLPVVPSLAAITGARGAHLIEAIEESSSRSYGCRQLIGESWIDVCTQRSSIEPARKLRVRTGLAAGARGDSNSPSHLNAGVPRGATVFRVPLQFGIEPIPLFIYVNGTSSSVQNCFVM